MRLRSPAPGPGFRRFQQERSRAAVPHRTVPEERQRVGASGPLRGPAGERYRLQRGADHYITLPTASAMGLSSRISVANCSGKSSGVHPKGIGRIAVDLHQQAVGPAGQRRLGHRRNQLAQSGAVRRIHEDRGGDCAA